MLTHSGSDGEFPIYSRGERRCGFLYAWVASLRQLSLSKSHAVTCEFDARISYKSIDLKVLKVIFYTPRVAYGCNM